MQIPVQIGVNGQMILGMFHLPEKSAPGFPTILFCSGLDGKRSEVHRMMTLAARKAERMGVSMLRFDYRGLGLSDGEFWQTSISRKIDDTLAVIDFIRGCYQDKRFCLIPLGFSDGARIASGLYKERAWIGGMVMWNPIFNLVDANMVGGTPTARIVRHPVTKELVFPLFNGLWLGMEYLREQTGMGNATEDFYGFTGPKLTIFGGDDLITKDTREDLEKGEHGKVAVIPGANHTFNRSVWAEKVIDQTMEWAIEVGSITNN
jgi:pimeloyl-ACP methyl ester carboxylesterase